MGVVLTFEHSHQQNTADDSDVTTWVCWQKLVEWYDGRKTQFQKLFNVKILKNSDASLWSLKGRKARWLIYIWRYVDTCIYLVLSIVFVILYCGGSSGIFYSWKTQIRKVSKSERQEWVIHEFVTLIQENSITGW